MTQFLELGCTCGCDCYQEKMVAWPRVADFSQKGITAVLFSLTVYGLYLLSTGGYRVVKRHKERKALEVILR